MSGVVDNVVSTCTCQIGIARITRFTQMRLIPYPFRVALRAVAHIEIIGRLNPQG